jgi:hypothetical protein
MGMITCRKCGHSFADFGWLCPQCWPQLFGLTILLEFILSFVCLYAMICGAAWLISFL